MSDVRRSWITVGVTILGLVMSIFLVSQLKFNYDFSDFFPTNDPETDYFHAYSEAFETDFDYFIVVIERPEGIFDSVFLQQVDALNDTLKSLSHVVEAVGPTQVKDYVRDPMLGGVFVSPWLNKDNPAGYAMDSTRIYQNGQWIGIFFAPDGKSVAINMKHTPNLAVNKCDSLYAQIQQKVADTGLQHTHLIGRAKGQKMYVDLMIQEVILFVSLSLLLTVIFLFIAFRSALGVVIPSLIVLLTILFTLAFMKILGKDMDLMLTILPTIIFVVGMSDSVHVLTKYLQELREGKEKVAAIKSAFKSIRLATFLTALTTAIGFLTLIFSSIQPISDFGVYTSIGVLLAYGLTYTLLPAILILSKPTRLNSFAMSEDFWTRYLHRWFAWVLSNRKKILVGMGIAIVIAGVGIFSIQVDNLMVEDLKDDHPIRQDFAFMEERFAGCRPFELCLELPAGQSAYDSEVLQELDSLGKYIRQHFQAGALFSLAEVVKSANRSLNAGMEDYRMIPTDSLELRQVRRFVQRRDLAAVTDLTYNQERHWLRVTGRMSDAGRQHYDSLNHEMTHYIQHSCPHLGKPHVTGTAYLMDLNNGYLVDNMLLDLLLSVSVIGLIMGLVYRSWRMIPLTIIPNLIPLILVAGIMGFAGIQLKISTSIIFNIAFGIAVDDTIHFLARVRTYQTHGKSPLYAVKRTFLTTGKAMVVTTLILSGGFVTLMFSDFLGSFYIGFLISLTLFIALICELLISPLLLILYRVEKKGN